MKHLRTDMSCHCIFTLYTSCKEYTNSGNIYVFN